VAGKPKRKKQPSRPTRKDGVAFLAFPLGEKAKARLKALAAQRGTYVYALARELMEKAIRAA